MALFKQPDNIVKIISSLNPDLNPYNPKISTKNDVLDPLKDISLAFGESFITPVLVYKQTANFYNIIDTQLQHGVPEFRFYALSAAPNKNWLVTGGLSSYIQRIIIDGQYVTHIDSVTFFDTSTTFRNITQSGIYWGAGRKVPNPSPTVGVASNPAGNFYNVGTLYEHNLYCAYLKAGDDFRQHPFYTAFIRQNPNLFVPDNKDYDMLIMLLRYDNRVFKSNDPLIQVSYYRYPVIFDPGINGRVILQPTRGNCLLELLTNSSYGLNLPESKFVRSEFLNVGENISGQFDIVKTPIGEIINIIDNESATHRVTEIGGVIRYASVNNTGLAITDDNIIGDISIEYPDAKTSPTQLIGTYNSSTFGSTDVIVGTDPTNVEKINIRTAGTLEEAKLITTQIFTRLQNTITIKFRGDRTLQQFSIYDVVTLSTTNFSATIKIIDITMLDDYTFNITAEADTGDAVPTARLGSARPVIRINDAIFIKPNPEEQPFEEPDVIEPIIVPPELPPAPPPDEIAPPVPQLVTIAGLEHPYNFVTQSYNTNWYLGSTLDGTTIDSRYDSNGIRTRFIPNYRANNFAPFYEMDYSLIYRQPTNAPITILAVTDIHESTSEYTSQLIGRAVYIEDERLHFPGFFNDLNNKVRSFKSTRRSWATLSQFWFNYANYSPTLYGGNIDPEFKKSYELPNYVYQVGDMAELKRRFTCPHTFEASFSIPRSRGDYWYSTEPMRRLVGGTRYYRLHFTALYGFTNRSITRAEYIGSTSFWGDGRGMLQADRDETYNLMRNRQISVPLVNYRAKYPSIVAPPPRNQS